jgi:hypothetical protein
MTQLSNNMDQRVQKIIEDCLGSPVEVTCEGRCSTQAIRAAKLIAFQELNCAIKLLKLAKRTLEDRLGAMRSLENRRVPQENHIVNYLHEWPADSIMKTLERVEKTFRPERWPRLESVEDMLSLRTQFPGLEQYNLPAQRVVIAALQLESRNNCISRIRNVFIADAIDTSVNENGFPQSSLQPALEQLANDLNEDDLSTLKQWRKSGEWLLDFFQHIPLGAICMMDKQTTMYVLHRRSG